jgi:hypothetical protein
MKYKLCLLVLYFILIVFFFLGRNFSTGVAYADDAYFACVAKNIANGLGYGSCVEGRGFVPFDPEISTGITVILPVAMGVYIFGNKWYIPGTICIFIWAILLINIYHIIKKTTTSDTRNSIDITSIFFLTLILLVFPKHFEQWSQMFGEIPAALLVIISFLIISTKELSYFRIAFSSTVYALASLTKLIVLPEFIILFGYLVFQLFLCHNKIDKIKAITTSLLFFIAPFCLLEILKIISLNSIQDYTNNILKLSNFITTQGVGSSASIFKLSSLYQRNTLIGNVFGISVLGVILTTCASLLINKNNNGILVKFAFMLAGAILLLSCYYLIFSVGWERYYIIALALWITLISITILSLKPIPGIAIGILVTGLIFFNNSDSIITRINECSNLYKMSNELKSALNCTDIIDKKINNSNTRTFVTQWWATTAEFEYYSKNTQLFKRLSIVPEGTAITFAYRKQFLDKKDITLANIFKNSQSVEFESTDHVIINSIR